MLVSSGRAMGPRAWSFWVEMPISAPMPYCSPSVKAVLALIMTAAESTSSANRCAVVMLVVQIASVWPLE